MSYQDSGIPNIYLQRGLPAGRQEFIAAIKYNKKRAFIKAQQTLFHCISEKCQNSDDTGDMTSPTLISPVPW